MRTCGFDRFSVWSQLVKGYSGGHKGCWFTTEAGNFQETVWKHCSVAVVAPVTASAWISAENNRWFFLMHACRDRVVTGLFLWLSLFKCTDCFLTCVSVSSSVVSWVEVIASVCSRRKTNHHLGFDGPELSWDILTGRIIVHMATPTNTNISANNISSLLLCLKASSIPFIKGLYKHYKHVTELLTSDSCFNCFIHLNVNKKSLIVIFLTLSM